MKELNVIIQGESNSGKTILARKIQMMLEEYDIDSEIKDQDFNSNEELERKFPYDRVENVMLDFGEEKKIKVNIKTQNWNRKDYI